MKWHYNRTFGSALIIGGTAIGAGMLALPMTTGSLGFWNSSLLFIVCFLFMLLSLFFLLEATLMCSREEGNIIAMVKERLGPVGQLVAWITFLLLLYSVAAAYLSGGGALVANWISAWSEKAIPSSLGIAIFLVIFGFIVVFETRFVDLINRYCMFALIAAFFLLVFFSTPHVQWSQLSEGTPKYLSTAIPVVILSFTSHIVVPSLRGYLRGDIRKLKISLFWGSVIPLVFYLVWNFLIIGMLPLRGEHGLLAISISQHPVAQLTAALTARVDSSLVANIVGCFSFFALITSFFGVALSLYHFLADGFHIKKNIQGRLFLLVLMFAPPLLFALFAPEGFLLALGYAGVFVAILYGFLPGLMVWRGRYVEKKKLPFRVCGGKPLLLLLFLGSAAIIFFQIGATSGLFSTPTAL